MRISLEKKTRYLKELLVVLLLVNFFILSKADTDIITSSKTVKIPPVGNLAFFTPNTNFYYFPGPSNTTASTTKLVIDSRIVHTYFAGSTGTMKISINGALVQAYVGVKDGASGSLCRLTNKPISAPVTPTIIAPWFYEVVGTTLKNYWRVIYAPTSGGYPYYPSYYNPPPYEKCNPYRLELDITDLVKPNVQNEVRITNLGTNYDLEIINLKIKTISGTSPLVTSESATVKNIKYGDSGLEFYATVSPATGALLKIYDGKFNIINGNNYCVEINGGTPSIITAAVGGILKTVIPQGTDVHVKIYAQ